MKSRKNYIKEMLIIKLLKMTKSILNQQEGKTNSLSLLTKQKKEKSKLLRYMIKLETEYAKIQLIFTRSQGLIQIGVKPNITQITTAKNLEHDKLKELFEGLKLQVESQIQRIKESKEQAIDLINQNAKKHVKQMTRQENMRIQFEQSELEKRQLAALIGQNPSPEGAPPPITGSQSPNINEQRYRIKAIQKEIEDQLREEHRKQQKEAEMKFQEERKKMLKKMGIEASR